MDFWFMLGVAALAVGVVVLAVAFSRTPALIKSREGLANIDIVGARLVDRGRVLEIIFEIRHGGRLANSPHQVFVLEAEEHHRVARLPGMRLFRRLSARRQVHGATGSVRLAVIRPVAVGDRVTAVIARSRRRNLIVE